MAVAKRLVPPAGPLGARVLWVGEAPGREEEIAGVPFVGVSGKVVRNALRHYHLDPLQDVRFTNVVKYNPGTFPTGKAGQQLIEQGRQELNDEINSMPNLKVVVLCGGVALRAVLSKESIQDWHGSMVRDTPRPGVYSIPVLHPAGLLRSSSRDGLKAFYAAVRKVRLVLDGTWKTYSPYIVMGPPPREIVDTWRWIYLDTEFDPESRTPYIVGVTGTASPIEEPLPSQLVVYSMQWPRDTDMIRYVMSRDAVKAGHNVIEDVTSLETVGIPVTDPWYDTMVVAHALDPGDLLYGLSHCAAHYLDEVVYWKDMDRSSPYYNALDVCYGAHIMHAQQAELAKDALLAEEVRWRMRLLPVVRQMHVRGMRVDMALRGQLLERTKQQASALWDEVTREVSPRWQARVTALEGVVREQERAIADTIAALPRPCAKHPTYQGLRKPPRCLTCVDTWALAQEHREKLAAMRKELNKRKAVLKQFEGGFNPRSPHHLAWLLYSHDGLGLPIVRDPKTRKPTTSQHAIEKLALRLKGQHRELVAKIKEVQHLEKARSTFLVLKREGRSIIDDQGYVHPAYKMTGTETGRLASGAGESEKSPALVNNALNIPDEWRVMYVPPPGMVFVAADWRALESRLTAYFSKDASYTSVLEEQLRGGPSVHAVVASLIYGVAPEDAKRTMVFFKGNKRPAYDAGKMCMHAWSYGMRPRAMVSHFGITLKEARHIDEVLSQRFQGVVRWRERLVQQVLGEEGRGGTRVLQNPFGWRRTFLGGPEQQNSVIAFLPQSTGASMWVRVAVALDEAGMHVVTGTYDSFLLAVPKDDEAVARAVQVLRSEMERSWPEMEGRTFPAEIAVGYNWGKASEDNPRGLTPV